MKTKQTPVTGYRTTQDLIETLKKFQSFLRKGKFFKSRTKVKCETMSGFKLFPAFELDLQDLTASFAQKGWSYRSSMVFLTHVYANGFLLGFRTDNPSGTCTDQDQSWVVIDPFTGKEIEEFEIRSYGFWQSGIVEKKKEWIEKFGKASVLKDEYGDRKWKLSECN